MYLLDSDILIWALRGKKEIVDLISRIKDKQPTCISVVSVAEIYMNMLPSEVEITEELLSSHLHFPVDSKTARQGGYYWQQYSKKISKLSITDCLIAATARVNDLTFFTLNTRHFPMTDIKVLNPLKLK